MVDIDQFAVWDEDSQQIRFDLSSDTDVTAGLHRAKVTLSDGQESTSQFLYVFVNDNYEEENGERTDNGKPPINVKPSTEECENENEKEECEENEEEIDIEEYEEELIEEE